eukprot:TRINITY_DN22177_c0_g1_i1.p1 TRINITY_DN22177_c0_g1~~TRINITY_DN22177_c0_g1_i1.p1  ORF type:complete len:167 (+),score=7.07 TRINITY_DN22177_c0_g1_i1:168-668(+)
MGQRRVPRRWPGSCRPEDHHLAHSSQHAGGPRAYEPCLWQQRAQHGAPCQQVHGQRRIQVRVAAKGKAHKREARQHADWNVPGDDLQADKNQATGEERGVDPFPAPGNTVTEGGVSKHFRCGVGGNLVFVLIQRRGHGEGVYRCLLAGGDHGSTPRSSPVAWFLSA